MRMQQQLDELGNRLTRAQQDLAVVREQVSFQGEVVDEAQVRMIVSGTPLGDREYRESRDDLARLKRHEEQVRRQIAELTAERDAVLDRFCEFLAAEPSPNAGGARS